MRSSGSTPLVWPVSLVGAGACVYTMAGLPRTAWERFGLWLALGLFVYLLVALFNAEEL